MLLFFYCKYGQMMWWILCFAWSRWSKCSSGCVSRLCGVCM